MIQEVVKGRNTRIVILSQILAFPVTCVLSSLSSGEDNADNSENCTKFTKYPETADCCYIAQIINNSSRRS